MRVVETTPKFSGLRALAGVRLRRRLGLVGHQRDEGDRPAGRLDHRLCLLAHPVHVNGDLPAELALAEQLHPGPAALHQAGLPERGLVHRGAGVERLEVAHVHHRERLAVRRVEAELWEAPLKRALSALEALEPHVAGARLLALAAAAGGLAQPGALTSAHALLPVPAVLRPPQSGEGFHVTAPWRRAVTGPPRGPSRTAACAAAPWPGCPSPPRGSRDDGP